MRELETEENPHLKAFSPEEDEDSNFLSDLDFIKFLIVAKKNLIWVLLIFSLSIGGAYIYLRYTNPIFQSSAILKLEVKNKANQSIMPSPTELDAFSLSDLSGEIELIKSNLVLNQVVESLNLRVAYFLKGKILNEERYHNSPFVLEEYSVENDNIYNKNIYINLLSDKEFAISLDQKSDKQTYLFGEEINFNGLKVIIKPTVQFTEELKSLNFYFIVYSKPAVLQSLVRNLEVEVLNPDARTLLISFKDLNATKAVDIVNTIDSTYLIEGLADKYRSSEQTIKYLEDLLRQNESHMERYEKEIQNFIVKNKSTDLKSDVLKNIAEVEKLDKSLIKMRENELKINELLEIISSDKKVDELPLITADKESAALGEQLKKYDELRKQRELLLLSNKEGTMVVRLNNMEINSLKKELIKTLNQLKKLVFDEIVSINFQKSKLEDLIFNATPKDNDLKKIQRLYGFYERMYTQAFDKKIEFEIAKAATVPSFRVLSPPAISKTPIYPIKSSVYSYGLGLAFVLSIILVIIQYFLHNTIDNLGELEKGTIAPVLGYVPKFMKGKLEFSSLVVDKSPKGPITEALRTIRTNIEFLLPNKNKRVISVTSTISGEGKTFVSINLAGVIALSGQKVVIIDLDMRKPKIHKAFNDENNKGVSTILIGKNEIKECVKPTDIESLYYIPSGPIPPNPSELIISKEFEVFLEKLKNDFDTIILDSPPVGLVTDGVLIMKNVDLPIYVIRAEFSKKGFEKNVNRLIFKNNFKKLSVILNDFSNLSGYGYGYKYGYGYGYGYYSDEEKKDTALSRFKNIFVRK